MPFLAPDVIKLDRGLTQDLVPPSVGARVINAVRAEAERSGATILAEGIETERHLERALAMGAKLGQGWLFGRPGPLNLDPRRRSRDPRAAGASSAICRRAATERDGRTP